MNVWFGGVTTWMCCAITGAGVRRLVLKAERLGVMVEQTQTTDMTKHVLLFVFWTFRRHYRDFWQHT
jgi:hypothetical protein